jgi:hypothetical protein
MKVVLVCTPAYQEYNVQYSRVQNIHCILFHEMYYTIKYTYTYKGVSKSFWTESIKKYMLTTINTQEAAQRVMVAKLTRLIHKMVIQLHFMADSCTICSSCSRWLVWKLLDTPSYANFFRPGTPLVKSFSISSHFGCEMSFHYSIHRYSINQ